MELKEMAYLMVSVIPIGFVFGMFPHLIGLGISGIVKIIKSI